MRGPRRFLLMLASAAIAWPQTPASSNQPEIVTHEAPVTFSSRVNLVAVPVVVRDRDGRAIGSLKQEDFQLFDKGKAQTISRFEVEMSARAAEAGPSEAPTQAAPAEAPKPQLPSRFVAFLFDDVHTKPDDLLRGKLEVNRRIESTLDPGARVAIFTTSARYTQDFTNDPVKLHAAIDKILPWTSGTDKQQDCPYLSYYVADLLINQTLTLSPGQSDDAIQRNIAMDQILAAVFSEAAACMHTTNMQLLIPAVRAAGQLALANGKEETMLGLSVVREVIRSMSTLPGSRSVVMVSPGFLLATEHRVFENDILDKAIQANVVLNTLDVRGLSTIPGMEASDRGYQGGSAGVLTQTDITAASQAQDLLAELAYGTGGTFFHNDNALGEGIRQLAAQPEYVYVLGYSPDNLKFDGSYHGIKVTLRNRVAAKIDARRGYWAPNHAISPEEEAREEIQDAVFSRQELVDIPVKLHTEFFKQSDTKAELTVESRLNVQGLKFRKADDRNRDKLTVVTGVFDQNGRYVKGIERDMDMQLRDSTLEAARNAGILVKENFDLAPGIYIVRVVVRDTEGRSMAAQNQGVEIP